MAPSAHLSAAESEDFDRITRLAAEFFGMPTALVSMVTADEQWFRSRVGMDGWEPGWDAAFCAFALKEASVLVVEDASQDQRFRCNRLVKAGPGIRFYAGAPLITRSGQVLGSLCIIDYKPRSFTTAQRAHLEDMARLVMAQIDLSQSSSRIHEVTGLPNRAQWAVDLGNLAAAGSDCRYTLVLVDIMSHQRLQNEMLAVGIAALELGLRLVVARFKAILSDRSALYHVSDTRFAFVLQGADIDGHAAATSQILAELSQPIQGSGMSIELELECGAVAFEAGTSEACDVLRKATSAMYQAQRRQLPFMMYKPSFDEAHRLMYSMLRSIPAALAAGELRLVYQPKFDLLQGRFSAVEALIRWRSPKWGDVAPAKFIPAIESTPTIHLLTEWVLHAALVQAAAWQAQGLFVSMAVNVSARNLEHPHFVKVVRNACRAHRVDPSYLHIECTENAVLTGERSLGALNELREMGVQLSLDDFGIGYSNLACLQKLPVSLLKIDQSLVKPIATDHRAWILLKSLISLGHTLGYRVLAEGVETQEIYRLLADADCDAMQGYFLSKPMEAGAIPAFMRDQVQASTARQFAAR